MAFTRAADGTTLAYEVFGRRDGEPVLLIHGLGADARGWALQKWALGSHFRCIAVDNRGVGRSGKPPGPYDIGVMADDALAALDAEGVTSAHVVGASMGGIIAQSLVVRHPERVRSLVLACTACQHHPWRRELLEEWIETARWQGMPELIRRNMRWLVGPRSLRRLWPAMTVLGPLAFSVPADAFCAQVQAILDEPDGRRELLAGVRVPTLVIVGSQDMLTTLGDSEEIASLVPGAVLAVVRGGAHLFMVEHAGEFNRTVAAFLETSAVPVDRRLTAAGAP